MLNRLQTRKKQGPVTVLLLALIYVASMLCAGTKKPVTRFAAAGIDDSSYAGAAACMNCHSAIHQSFTGTAHDLTSRPAAARYIKGNLEAGKNRFTFNKFIQVAVENQKDSFFQTVYVNGAPTQSEPIDIVVGSGKKGQTYLYWQENLLFQLPVSYYAVTKDWCNSPGYPPGMPRFNRLIPGRCLECHGSRANIEDAGNNVNYIDRNSVVYGVDCERCHGPAAQHVAFQTTHPGEKNARFILSQKSLSRQQKLDLCALCHSGIRQATQPAFSFKAGDKLEDFSLPVYNADSAASLDVHGNQYGLLTASKCFKSSQMTCSSCHNVHSSEVDKPALFSQRCMSCHNSTSHNECTVKQSSPIDLSANCIDCHMPSLPSKAIFLQLEDASKSTADFVRTHRIAIYPGISKAFIRKAKRKHG